MKILLLLLISFQVIACPQGFAPENNLRIPVMDKDANLTEEDFNTIIDEITALYRQDIREQGGELKVVRDWANETVNAFANRKGNEWIIYMYGGLARHKFITKDAFALVVCHELGHHVGGFPRFSGLDFTWSTNEGQSDYFSSMKCLRRYWQRTNNESAIRSLEIPATLKDRCEKAWFYKTDEELCQRIGMAGHSTSVFFGALAWSPFKPKFEKPSSKVTSYTLDSHPPHQCRLDTYFQGALCDVSYTEDFRGDDEVPGSCHLSLGHSEGMRPLCWFKPKN